MQEIEITSRLYVEDGARYMTATLVCNSDTEAPRTTPVTFILSGHRLVVLKLEFRDAFEAEAGANLAPQERGCAVERAGAVPPRCLVAEHRVEHPRELNVRTHLHAGERDESEAGIVNLAREQLRQFAANLIGDAIGPGALGHLRRLR